MERLQNYKEEKLNVITHGLGALLSVFGLIYLLNKSPFDLEKARLGIWVYGLSLIFLYFSSSIYHFVRSDKLKRSFRILDHISIYYLIAGTYTPVCLSILQDSYGNALLISAWSIAGVGTILKLFFTGKFEKISLLLYLIMGWLIIVDISFVLEAFSTTALLYLAGGGLAYTIGIVFYVRHKMNYHHVVWHLFVMIGSLCHFLMIENLIN